MLITECKYQLRLCLVCWWQCWNIELRSFAVRQKKFLIRKMISWTYLQQSCRAYSVFERFCMNFYAECSWNRHKRTSLLLGLLNLYYLNYTELYLKLKVLKYSLFMINSFSSIILGLRLSTASVSWFTILYKSWSTNWDTEKPVWLAYKSHL